MCDIDTSHQETLKQTWTMTAQGKDYTMSSYKANDPWSIAFLQSIAFFTLTDSGEDKEKPIVSENPSFVPSRCDFAIRKMKQDYPGIQEDQSEVLTESCRE